MGERPLRIVTAVAAYDGHDASVLALNRALLKGTRPVEIIYIGFNMTGEKIASAALEEGADAVAVSSYNGGHLQFFPDLLRCLAENGMEGIPLFGGGGGTIIADDAAALEAEGVARIYGPGWPLDAIAEDLTGRVAAHLPLTTSMTGQSTTAGGVLSPQLLSRLLTMATDAPDTCQAMLDSLPSQAGASPTKTVVVSGDGGSGKSTLIDELVRYFLETFPEKRIAVLANDPTTSSGGSAGALLADRVRMNNIYDNRVWLRSVATGAVYAPISPTMPHLLRVFRAAGYDLALIETPGTGQTGIDLRALGADLLVHVKTREYGGGIQLMKDQLLADAHLVVLNKADLGGSEAAFEELRGVLDGMGKGEALHPATAKNARDPGIARLFAALCSRLGWAAPEPPSAADIFDYAKRSVLVPHRRRAYLAEVAARVRAYDSWKEKELRKVREDPGDLAGLDPYCARLLQEWPELWRELSRKAEERLGIIGQAETVNGLKLPRVALPDPSDRAGSLRFLLEEGLPGMFPFATGVHPFRLLSAQETTRQFAGLRGPEETNSRLHFLANGVARPRLSIAFDGITLYGADSDEDPGSVGKIGEGGVAVDTWEDMKLVLDGFRIPDISTSMTINGPAPVVLAMYFVAALESEFARVEREKGRPLDDTERVALRRETMAGLRGTVQADILKEVQAQNESIFQPDFAIRLLGDVQEWFIENGVKKFYSLSISGYHIGEAGASPVRELAFTLANGFTYVENFLARGMAIDSFAPSLSFFFKVSHEAEWLAYGAVCRKIWAIAMRDQYGAGEHSQKLRFHTQTSGRALQAEEWDTMNPVRLTYHALLGLLANADSLHVDSADEPMTTPGEKWVRQATMIPNYLREEAEGFVIQNLLSGSYAFRALMGEVQERILQEFDRLDQLGGVGPATEQGYQRRCIAADSARYEEERRRRTREEEPEPRRRIIGYNSHVLPAGHPDKHPPVAEVVRPGPADWERQLARVRDFRERHREDAPHYLAQLKDVALQEGNVFGELLETVRHATLGQITHVLAEVGGRYRKMV
ncbi:MAG TPA: methylmalonyl-CoA mutase family protein [Geobacteraceae bacterium]|nr:methylmalonyl-CoA mutase family protein [Geobacteraceae bacterium]